MNSYTYKKRWRDKAKQWLVRYAGSQCQSCGYDKWIGNLAFHHVSKKTADIRDLLKNTASWSRILAEADLCVLVCHNCHGEIHAGLRDCPDISLSRRKKTLKQIIAEQPLPKTEQYHDCICGKRINRNYKYCSHQCSRKDREIVDWPINLPDLVAESSKSAVARQLGVSDKAVAKRLRHHHQV